MRIVVLGPHLDDCTFSAGQFMAAQDDVTAVSVFAGVPANASVVTAYDSKYGFGSAAQAMQVRLDEDTAACAMLRAHPVHLGFTDSQYGEARDRAAIKNAIATQIEDADLVLAPVGVLHPDHVMVRELAFELFNQYPMPLRLYEDLPYRVTNPETIQSTLEAMRMQGYQLTFDAYPDYPLAPKLSAIMCYKSQLGGDINLFNLCVGERFWQVARGKTR